jgi:hypothetical protein
MLYDYSEQFLGVIVWLRKEASAMSPARSIGV